MKTKSTWIAIAAFVVWLVLAWFIGSWIGLKPPVLYYLRGGLWLLGIVGLVGFFLLRPKSKTVAPQGEAANVASEIDFNFNEAAKRMKSAGVKNLGSLPAIFLIGDTGSAKTSVIAKSGIEPELLAGQAFQDYVVAPTRALNLWYSRKTLFVDPSGTVLGDPGTRKKLAKKFLPVQLNAVMGGSGTAGRAVVLTVDCETFVQQGGAETLGAKGRQYQALLGELAQELGSSFPVYVLFTKADRIPFFREFVEHLTEDEAADVLGVTLPMQLSGNNGVYAETQTRRLTDAFQDLYYSIADKRPPYLGREHDPGKLPDVYEFPREFAKLRPLLVQFLVDLCRPTQLGTSPFLRGFYFTGVRPVTVGDVGMPAQSQSLVDEQPLDAGATRIFSSRNPSGGMLATPQPSGGARKMPQWVFLGHLFTDLILADQPATAATAGNVKVNFARRLMFAAVAALALVMTIWWAVSYFNNRGLVNDATAAAQAVPNASLPAGQLASTDALARLTRIKNQLAVLKQYDKDGAPWSYRAFLYSGQKIEEPLRETYYALFRKILLAPTQETLLAICSKPDAYQDQGYRYVYDALKAYLITTNHHEKSTAEFLTPVLLDHWQKGQQIDIERQNLARQNFEFYAEDLEAANPYPNHATPDAGGVESARAYLKKFAQEESIYLAMLAAAGKGQKPIIFNVDYPGSAATVVNNFKVDPAYTKGGFANFTKELKDPDRYFTGEEWVLGPQTFAGYDKQKVVADLTQKYQKDFAKTWRDYLHATSVVGYKDVPDAVTKLQQTTGPQSPLLQVLCVAAENTSVENKDVAQIFQPVQFVTPAGCKSQLAAGSNNGYMGTLIQLQTALQTVGPNFDPAGVAQANTQAQQAEVAVGTLARNFAIDQGDIKSGVDSKTAEILRDPITRVSALLKGAAGGPANGAAAGLCASIAPMLTKYPFNPKSTQDATLQEVTEFLKPNDGKLWQMYNSALKPLLIPAGTDYVAAPGQQVALSPAFISFFNRAAHMSQALFKTDAPNFSFAMQPLAAADVDHVTLTIDGQTLSADVKNGGHSQTFTWPGATQGVYLGVKFGSSPEFQIAQTTGLWAIWHFLDSAEKWQPSGAQYDMEWVQKTSAGVTTINGHPAAVKFALDPQGTQVFRPRYFAGFGCVSKAVQ